MTERGALRLLLLVPLLLAPAARGQMVSGADIPGFSETFELTDAAAFEVDFLGSDDGNVLWPGETAEFRFQVRNASESAIQTEAKVDLIAYGTRGTPGDIWVPVMSRIARYGGVALDLDIPVGGYRDLSVTPTVPERLGAYALVLDLGPLGRRFVTSFVRTFRAEAGRVRFPQLCLDNDDPALLSRLGAAPNRIGISFKPTSDPDFEAWYARIGEQLAAYRDAGLAITVEFGGGDFEHPCQPLGRPRPWLDEAGTMLDTKFDLAWLPSYDDEFRELARRVAADWGWPKGPVNGIKLWNEPWNGISISGWGADDERYREMFTAMCEGVEQARREDGVNPLLGGCDSSSNTFDKLFADGSDTFLPWLDFCSIHYQGMSPPSTVKAWLEREGPNGRVRIWDTESWVANTDDRVATVVATNLSTGHDRAVGIHHGNVATEWHARHTRVRDGEDWREIERSHTWSVAAAVGAATHFIGERRFRELLYPNGLPWAMVFDGRPSSSGLPTADDGTIVVIGDIGEAFGADTVPFRTARGLAELKHEAELRERVAALPASEAEERARLEAEIERAEPLSGARLVLPEGARRCQLYDFYGNEIEPVGRDVVVPLDHRGFYLRAAGGGGSFATLVHAVRNARVEGIEPLATVCHDLLARIEEHPRLRLDLTNVLPSAVSGTLHVEVGGLTLERPEQQVRLRGNETKRVEIDVVSGATNEANAYPLTLRFDAGADGVAEQREELHVNVIAHLSPRIDGRLEEWEGIPAQTATAGRSLGPTLQEYAWQPFKDFPRGTGAGIAHAWLGWDEEGFSFAARIADSSDDPGMPRFAVLDEDEYFYPAVPTHRTQDGQLEELHWPEGVRRYSYRKDPELPCGNAPNHDNVQIAFNVLPDSAKPWLPNPPHTMYHYTGYRDTDYEYALNPVAQRYGGGVEVWPLRRPDLPEKHYYPRQPDAPGEGPVTAAQLSIRRTDGERRVECFLPWGEIPEVKRALDAGRTVKFSFRANDNVGNGCVELSRGRSVAKRNGSFKADWVEHWANELEFAFEGLQ